MLMGCLVTLKFAGAAFEGCVVMLVPDCYYGTANGVVEFPMS